MNSSRMMSGAPRSEEMTVSLRDRVIVLDFDGVVWDSADESFEQAWIAWQQVDGRIDMGRAEANRVFDAARWQCKDGHDFHIVMTLIAEGRTDVSDMPASVFRQARETVGREAAAEAFVKAFYDSRERMRDSDFEYWCSLQRPFPGVVEQIETLRREALGVAVATTKDASSARALLEHAGLHEMPIYGREVSLDKNDHMRAIQTHYGVQGSDMAFVEDLLENLHNVAAHGMKLVLADWGYNTPADRERARAAGITVVSLTDFAARVRGLWDC